MGLSRVLTRVLAGPSSRVRCVAARKDMPPAQGSSHFAICTQKGVLYLYQFGKEHQPLSSEIEQGTCSADWARGGSVIAVGTDSGSVLLVAAANLAILQSVKANSANAAITWLRFSPQGDLLAAGCAHKKLWLLGLQGRGGPRMHGCC